MQKGELLNPMSAIFTDIFIKLLTHAYVCLICRELELSKWDTVWILLGILKIIDG